MAREAVRVAAFHTEMSVVDRRIGSLDANDVVVCDVYVHLAADAAVAAGRSDGRLGGWQLDMVHVGEGAGGTGGDARPTGDAGRGDEVASAPGETGLRSAPFDRIDELPLYLLAGAYAAAAEDAGRQVDLQVEI